MYLVAGLVPERFAAARDWAAEARSGLRSDGDLERAFAEAGARPIGGSYALERDTTQILKTSPAFATIGGVTASEDTGGKDARAWVYTGSGGGSVDAPLVFAGRGVSPADYPPQRTGLFAAPDLGAVIERYADEYANIDVRGKVVLLVRFMGVRFPIRTTIGPDVESQVTNAIKRGAAAVIFVDPDLPRYVDVPSSFFTPVNPYKRLEGSFPVGQLGGTPVLVISVPTAQRLLASTGLDITGYATWLEAGSDATARSGSRELGLRARVAVPLERVSAHIRTIVAEVGDVPRDAGRVLVWAVRRPGAAHPAADVLGALVGSLVARRVPFVFVDFDVSVDPNGNARMVADALKDRRIALILVLDALDGSDLRFTTPFGELVPAIDHYAEKASAPHIVTRATQDPTRWTWPGIAPFAETKAVLIAGAGGGGDLRADAAALIGYIAGRYALGAEELPR
jgi:hypothetical protein